MPNGGLFPMALQAVHDALAWLGAAVVTCAALGIVYAWNQWATWTGWVEPPALQGVDEDGHWVPVPWTQEGFTEEGVELPPWTQEGFTVDEDGHWVPIGYYDDEDSDNGEDEGPEGFGAFIAGGGQKMHTARSCGGLRGAQFATWAVFCDNLQTAARTENIAEAWTLVGPPARRLCATEACAVVCHGGLVRIRNVRRRKMTWCSRCVGEIPHTSMLGEPPVGGSSSSTMRAVAARAR